MENHDLRASTHGPTRSDYSSRNRWITFYVQPPLPCVRNYRKQRQVNRTYAYSLTR
jgi:hypothetical protein